MSVNDSVKDLIGNFFRMDTNLEYFAPGYIGTKKITEDKIPWLGLRNLNRAIYLATTFNFYFFETMIADISIAMDAKGVEPIVIEARDNFTKFIELEKLGFLQSRVQVLPGPQMLVLKDIYKFMTNNFNKFNDFFENDPNIKLLAQHQGALSAPLFLEDDEVYEYYEKGAKLIFASSKK
ncbi:hypothetical protein [Spiroplasma culicicola]|uniref:Uncharacterized protein n=1 Tax=Spiroplasma culicicola AES-1 TaxID=1276246 RepID=W6AGM6_9MOLU|nr:hypothetical protein [Spiroplasma culicicola]AHI52834.1 hypothetical protein SCULI_v1c04930 [Spiroplasma culicicola AES-1]